MANEADMSIRQMAEGPWIEIIHTMESLYADLAWTQTDAESKNEELLRAKAFTGDFQ